MKKFENIYIASDIDGTFAWQYSYINEKNVEKVRYFNENGGHFGFSTGRNHYDTSVVVPMWKELSTMPCVLCNGSFLYDTKKDEIINPRYLEPAEKAVEAIRTVKEKFGDIAGVRVSFP
ncbi:MAG: HAD family hydrolase, partial [Eubacteriales bacterium]